MLNPEDLLASVGSFASSYLKDIQSKELIISGENYRYLEAGSGTPIILLHGVAGSRNFWRGVMSQLSVRYHVYALDIPGLYISSNLGARRATLSRLSEWLRLFIEAHNFEQVHIVTHSLSAGIAAHYAAAYPEKVKSLCWLALPQWFQSETGEEPLIFRLVEDMEKAGVAHQHQLWLETLFLKTPKVSKLMESFQKNLFKRYKHRVLEVLSDLRFSYRQLPARLNHIECSVLAIWGAQTAFESKGLQKKLKMWVPDIQIVNIPNCGHTVSLEKPKAFMDLYADFIASSDTNKKGKSLNTL